MVVQEQESSIGNVNASMAVAVELGVGGKQNRREKTCGTKRYR